MLLDGLTDWIDLRKILYSFNDSLKLRVNDIKRMNSRISFFYPLIVQQLLTVSAEVFKINKPVILILNSWIEDDRF